MRRARVSRTEVEGDEVLVVDKRSILSFFIGNLNQSVARAKLDGVARDPLKVNVSVQMTSTLEELGAKLLGSLNGISRGRKGKEETERDLHCQY